MLPILKRFIEQLESAIAAANLARREDGLSDLGTVKIRLLGQFALLVHPTAAAVLRPAATLDIDALVEGDWATRWLVRTIIHHSGYVYDDLSNEIWLPPGTVFEHLYESSQLQIEVITPVFNLVTKAVKAPERNRNLVVEGIAAYGEELVRLLKMHGANIEYFLERPTDDT